MEYISIISLFLIIVLISNIIGNLVIKCFKLSNLIPTELLGFLIWLSVLFITSQFINMGNISSSQLFLIFLVITFLLFIFGLRFIKFNYSLIELGIIFAYTMILIFLSARYTMGEQLGDNVFLFTFVTKNIDASLLNNFEYGSGYFFGDISISTDKDAQIFYYFTSFILHYFYKIKNLFNSDYIPAYVLNMWVNNILFYFLSSSLIISIRRIFKLRLWSSILLITFSGLFIGTYYYNLTLPHFGVTYLGLGISMALLLVYQYLETKEKNYVFVLTLVFFAMNSMATAGMLISAYIAFGFISVLIFRKDDKALFYAGVLLIPIALYTNQVSELIKIPFLVYLLGILVILLIALSFIKPVKDIIYKYFNIILIVLWILVIITSILVVPDYFNQISHFGDIKENFDRVRDYFSFTNPYQTILNLFHYILLINIMLNRRTRDFGLILALISIFFINPLSYPLLYQYTDWLYHRSYFVLFNITTISIGIYATISNLKNIHVMFRLPIRIVITVLIVFFTFTNVTTYENVIYIPSDDFSPLYKMNRQQIDVLLKLYYEVKDKDKENTRVISQIYGSLMMVPDMYHYKFTVSDRRYWIPDEPELFTELYQMMYTPVFPGDDGPRLSMNYWRLCDVLEQEVEKVDYLLLDNSLVTFDEVNGNWVPMHWFARGCGEKIYENERYTIYKYWG